MATNDGGRKGEDICTIAGSHEKMEELREAGEIRNQGYRDIMGMILQEIEGGSALSQFLKTQPQGDENSILFFRREELEKAVHRLASMRQEGRMKERYWKRLQAKSKDNQRLAFALRQAEEMADVMAGTIMENNLELPSEEHTDTLKERDITPDRSEGEEEIREVTRSILPGAPTIDDDQRKSKGKQIVQETQAQPGQLVNHPSSEDIVGGTSHPLPGAVDDLVDQLYDLDRPEDQPTPTPPRPARVFEAKYKRWDLLPEALSHMN
ncbi:hypothetical protein R1sor_011931 [Riccia sorocarpa]|uniref:Uncharacterized protein n=1 Tax=Riccia sorocarpa TaxID=122646 RepID=A0ABD3I5Y7_9MARC